MSSPSTGPSGFYQLIIWFPGFNNFLYSISRLCSDRPGWGWRCTMVLSRCLWSNPVAGWAKQIWRILKHSYHPRSVYLSLEVLATSTQRCWLLTEDSFGSIRNIVERQLISRNISLVFVCIGSVHQYCSSMISSTDSVPSKLLLIVFLSTTLYFLQMSAKFIFCQSNITSWQSSTGGFEICA